MSENTPEKIAFDLMDKISLVEKRSWIPDPDAAGYQSVNREWILRTYAQCLETVRNPDLVHDILEKFTG